MHPFVILGASAFAIALLLTPLFRNALVKWGLVDAPDHVRKLHATPVPNMGGIPIAIAYAGSFVLLRLLGPNLRGTTLGNGILDSSLALQLLLASVLILAIGLLDDWLQLQPLHKIAGQTLAAMVVFASGVRITGFDGVHLPLAVSFVATIVWLLACTNAFNLIDGIDGLAAGVGLFATATTLIAALLQHNIALAAATVPLLGALIGFLRYNFNPATIFLGDSGSFLVGFLLGCFGIIWSQKSATILGMTAPLMALSVPILDAMLSIVRRFLRRKPIMRGDRGHVHHRLLERGLSQRKVVLLLYLVAGIGAGFSLLVGYPSNHYAGAIILVFCAVAWIGIQNLGYDEFEQARRLILNGGFRRALNLQLELRTFRKALDSATSTEEAWELLVAMAKQLGFLDVRWNAGGRVYRDEFSPLIHVVWSLRIPLHETDYVELTRGPGEDEAGLNVGAFVEAIRGGLTQPQFSRPAEVSKVHSAFRG